MAAGAALTAAKGPTDAPTTTRARGSGAACAARAAHAQPLPGAHQRRRRRSCRQSRRPPRILQSSCPAGGTWPPARGSSRSSLRDEKGGQGGVGWGGARSTKGVAPMGVKQGGTAVGHETCGGRLIPPGERRCALQRQHRQLPRLFEGHPPTRGVDGVAGCLCRVVNKGLLYHSLGLCGGRRRGGRGRQGVGARGLVCVCVCGYVGGVGWGGGRTSEKTLFTTRNTQNTVCRCTEPAARSAHPARRRRC